MSSHPLAPLTTDEVRQAARLLQSADGLSDRVRIVSIELREPAKVDYLAWRDGGGARPDREASCVLVDCGNAGAVEAVVSLTHDRLLRQTSLPNGTHPAIHIEEFVLAGDVCLADPTYVAALALRGITDLSLVRVEAWAAGDFEDRSRRLVRAIAWLGTDDDADNYYARPLYGLVAVVDLNTMAMVRLDDHAPGTPVPDVGGQYTDGGGQPYR